MDLKLEAGAGPGQLWGVVVDASGIRSCDLAVPEPLLRLQASWWRLFEAHHGQWVEGTSAEALQTRSEELVAAMAAWLETPPWGPLREALQHHRGAPLRISLDGALLASRPAMDLLPWEALEAQLDRPIWRLVDSSGPGLSPPARERRPRLLLVLGRPGGGIDVAAECAALEALHRRGRIELHPLSGPGCTAGSLRQALGEERGWDGFLFLGHSEADPAGGGRLQLGDGTWMQGMGLVPDLETAARHGLRLVLFNSCSGAGLARASLRAGIAWALGFRERIPDRAASEAFAAFLAALEQGQPFPTAAATARQHLAAAAPGSQLLLSAFARRDALPLHLPLRRRRLCRLRLATSQPRQLVAAGAAMLLAGFSELLPWTPLPAGLLDRRMGLQWTWRQATGQQRVVDAGPALDVLLLSQDIAYPRQADGQRLKTVSLQALADVLRRSIREGADRPGAPLPSVGFDFVIDDPLDQPGATQRLADVLRSQPGRFVFNGYYPPNSRQPVEGRRTQAVAMLRESGMQSRSLSLGIAQGGAPLQLLFPLTAEAFASALAGNNSPNGSGLPAGAVIDWSVDWFSESNLRRIEAEGDRSFRDLAAALRGPMLLVGRASSAPESGSPQPLDVSPTPLAVRFNPSYGRWGEATHQMPNPLVHAVLARSIASGHWLTPLSPLATTALAAGLGVVLAAYEPRPGRRLLLVGLIGVAAVPVGLQLAVAWRLLVPLALPLGALVATAAARREGSPMSATR